MPLSRDDVRQIQEMVNRVVGQVGEPFVVGEVIDNDQTKKLVWLKELGDQPIPIIAFDYKVKYYVKQPTVNTVFGAAFGALFIKTAVIPRFTKSYSNEVEILVPQIGELVLVARHLGSDRLPKCLGVVKGTDYIQTSGDDE